MTKNWVKNDRILFFLKSEKIGGEQENILLLLSCNIFVNVRPLLLPGSVCIDIE